MRNEPQQLVAHKTLGFEKRSPQPTKALSLLIPFNPFTRRLRYHERHVDSSIKYISQPRQLPHTDAVAVVVMGHVSGCFTLSRVCRAGG